MALELELMTRCFTPRTQDVDCIIEPILVLKSKFLEVEQESIPDYFWPVSGKWKIRGMFGP
jgi:phenol 2-monooxygenase